VKRNRYFNLVSLGCPKNRVDSERLLFVMSRARYEYTDDPARAVVIIVNTCAFIEPAVEESVNTILDLCTEYSRSFIVVAGCLPLRYRDDLLQALPEVSLFITPDQVGDLPSMLRAALDPTSKRAGRAALTQDTPARSARHSVTGQIQRYVPFDSGTAASGPSRSAATSHRILTTPGYAYLKISEGCSRKCRYCTIPSIRGPLRSGDPLDLEREAAFLASRGVKELVLVAQDLTSYGMDRGGKSELVKLLERLGSLEGIRWIRLMYLYPAAVPARLSQVIRDSGNILPYLDIPFQHISDPVLKAMGRPWKGDRIRELVDRLRKEIPRLVLRTTLMVGFPGEGDREFQELVDFVDSCGIDHVGVFTYSPEEGTPAHKLGDPVPADVKQARADNIRELHWLFADKRNRRRIGSVEEVVVEGISEESELLLQGRTWDQAPEVDGVLYITAGEACQGDIRNARITGAHGPDLFGEIL